MLFTTNMLIFIFEGFSFRTLESSHQIFLHLIEENEFALRSKVL